jgi:hypothetical protein
MAAETIIQLRRGSAAAWSSQNPVLSAGEFGLETDTFKMKMGDGSTSWESLGYTVKQVDNLLLDANTISSVNENGDIVLDPAGEGVVNVSSARVTNVGAPTQSTDAATKAYVDATKQGLDVKNSVHVATTGNITLSGTQEVDGVALVAEDRVLVKNQSTASENGIYVVKAGAWERAPDADSDADVTPGMFTFVEEGTVNEDSGWVLTTDAPITVGSTSLAFAQFSGAGQVGAGDGLTKTGNTLDVVGTADRITVNADSVDIAITYVGQTSITTLGTVGTGSWNASVVDVAYGGTGATSLTGFIVGNGTGAFTTLASIPGSDISGVVALANGGTGATTITGAQSNLELVPGSDVQEHSSTLDAVAGGTYEGATSITKLGTVGTGTWNASPIDNAYLANSDVSFGGVTVSLGGTDATPAFDLSDATAYPGDSSLVTVGTVGTGTWNASVIDEVYGGTGLSSYTAGDIIYASATDTLSKLAKGSAKYFLKMDGNGDFPEWSNSLDGGTP